MSNNTPLIVELDSTYRCRNENPLPGKFTVDVIPKNDEIIKDPVSSQAPINYWRGANFITSTITDGTITESLIVKLVEPVSPDFIGHSSGPYDNRTIALIVEAKGDDGASPKGSLQTSEFYYLGASIGEYDSTDPSCQIQNRKRIYKYKYLGDDRACIIVDSGYTGQTDTVNCKKLFIIGDPTDLSNPTYPYFFVPNAPFIPNYFTGNYLYNHCKDEYRKINFFDGNKTIIGLDTGNSKDETVSEGPITNWNRYDIYSIREEIPNLCGTLDASGIPDELLDSTTFNVDPSISMNAGDFLEIFDLDCVELTGIDTSASVYEIEGSYNNSTSEFDISSSIPTLSDKPDFYNGCDLRFVDGSCGVINKITGYDGSAGIITISPGTNDISGDATAIITCSHNCTEGQNVMRKIERFVNTFGTITGSGTTLTITPTPGLYELRNPNNGFTGSYTALLSGLFIKVEGTQFSKIISAGRVPNTTDDLLIEVQTPIVGPVSTFTISSGAVSPFSYNKKLSEQKFCVLGVDKDYCSPLNIYSTKFQNPCTYEITLCNVVLPNIILDSTYGGRIAAYPYFYVKLTNPTQAIITEKSIQTNNKDSPDGVVFRVPVERQFTDESSKFFLSFKGDCPIYSKINPYSPLTFEIRLPNGDLFKNVLPENYSPCPPNPLLQISACFSFKRMTGAGIIKQRLTRY